MPGFLTNVIKGGFCGRSDTRMSRRAGESVAEFRQRLLEIKNLFTGGTKLHEIAAKKVPAGKDELVVRSSGEQKHAEDEFFGDSPTLAFFPNTPGDREDEIVRGAFIQALELSLASPTPKPIVTYWVVTGRVDGAHDAFEAFVTETSAEVHVLLLTPEPKNVPKPPPGGAIVENMFVVASNQRIQAIELKFQNESYPVIPVPLTGSGLSHVKCLRVIGY